MAKAFSIYPSHSPLPFAGEGIRSSHSNSLVGWPGTVLRLTECESTQDIAKAMAQDGSPEWTLILAQRQTRGRGRLGRRWSSPKGGLYFSLILRPQISPKRLGELSIAAAHAAARAATRISGLKTAVKPPNDVLACSQAGIWKKICGILIEASGDPVRTDWVIIGLGMNVNNAVPTGLPRAASMRALSGRNFDLDVVADEVLRQLKAAYAAFLSRGDS